MTTTHRLLLIEDEAVIRTALQRMLERNGYAVEGAASLADAEARFDYCDFDLIISDLRLPGEPGTALLRRCADVPILIMTSYASVKSAVDAMQKGAQDYIAKPFKHEELLGAIARILERGPEIADARRGRKPSSADADADANERDRSFSLDGIIGDCPAMHSVFEFVRKVAPTDSTVLILGESGTGKELIARAVHGLSARHAAPMIAVNCAAIPENLIETELFGHERGAFTGAVGSREGLVEAANGGTLFLDEIGELPASAQARLLRVLQEGEVRRLGTAYSSKVNIRLIAATHRDLQKLVNGGSFREDLYYRLRVMEIHLPALRERGDDIVALAKNLVEKSCSRLDRPALSLPDETVRALRQYDWPGNVRELENAIERAVILAEGETLAPHLMAIEAVDEDSRANLRSDEDLSLDDYFRNFVLTRQGEMTETEIAKQLGISRKSLWERRQRLNIPRSKARRANR